MVVPHLPRELIDQILDNLKEDEQTLRSCALTCFSWQQRSQMHLHRSIRLSERHRAIIIELYASHDLANYVHHIELRCKPPHPWHRMFQPNDPQPSRWLKDDTTYDTLALFPHVQSYRFSYMHFSTTVIRRLAIFFANCATPVTTLEIYEATFEDIEGFATLLASFPHLSSLRVDRCQWPHDLGFAFENSKLYEQENKRIPGPRLRTLRVMVQSSMRTDITKWCYAAGITTDFLEWKWEGHAHKAIFEPSAPQAGLCCDVDTASSTNGFPSACQGRGLNIPLRRTSIKRPTA